MPDLIEQLRNATGPDRQPSEEARQLGLARLQRQIDAELSPRADRRRRQVSALTAAAATALVAIVFAAASALVPTGGPAAQAVLERAVAAIAPDQDEVLTADIHGELLRGEDGTTVADYGTTKVWLSQLPGQGIRFRSLALNTASPGSHGQQQNDETVTYPSSRRGAARSLRFTTEVYTAADNRLLISPGNKAEMAPELFEARSLLFKARAGQDVTLDEHADLNGRPAYKLTWTENPPRADPTAAVVEMTLWIDRDSYAPLQVTDHSHGQDASGRPLDQTYKATISNFQRLADTEANRDALRMAPHPSAEIIDNR